jgi:hypothetical protein
MKPIAIGMKLIVFAVLGLVSLQQQLSMSYSRFNWSNDLENLAFAQLSGSNKPITQRLDYAHFLPLTNNSKLHQVKIIVDYSPISTGQYAYMKVYAPNGTLIKVSSSPNGVKTVTPGKAQFATTISNNRIKKVIAYTMFTNSQRSINYSNPISIELNLGQTIQPSIPKPTIQPSIPKSPILIH